MRVCAVLGAGLIVGWASTGWAASAKTLIKQGEGLYASGKYHEAAEVLRQAYDLEPSPALTFNIARAYDQAGDLALSLQYYQQYVSSSEGTDPRLLKRSALAIERLRGLVAKDEAAKQAREAEARRLAEAKAAAEKAEAEAAAAKHDQEEREAKRQAEVAARAEAEARARKRSKVGFFAVGGLAVVAAGTGGVFGYLTTRTSQQFTQATTLATKTSLMNQTKGQALIADIGYGVGLAAAVTAVLLYPRGTPEGPTKVVELSIGPSFATALVRF